MAPCVACDERQTVGEATGDAGLQTRVMSVEVAFDHLNSGGQPAEDGHTQSPIANRVGGEPVDRIRRAGQQRLVGVLESQQVNRRAAHVTNFNQIRLDAVLQIGAPLLRIRRLDVRVCGEKGSRVTQRVRDIERESAGGGRNIDERILERRGVDIRTASRVPHVKGIEIRLLGNGTSHCSPEETIAGAENQIVLRSNWTICQTDPRRKGQPVLAVHDGVSIQFLKARRRRAFAIVHHRESGIGTLRRRSGKRLYQVDVEGSDATVFILLVAVELIANAQVQSEAAVDTDIILREQAEVPEAGIGANDTVGHLGGGKVAEVGAILRRAQA